MPNRASSAGSLESMRDKLLASLENDDSRRHVVSKDDYKSQKFKRTVDVQKVQTYQERMSEGNRIQNLKKTEDSDQPRKRLKFERTNDTSDVNDEIHDNDQIKKVSESKDTSSTVLAAQGSATAPVVNGLQVTTAILDQLIPKPRSTPSKRV